MNEVKGLPRRRRLRLGIVLGIVAAVLAGIGVKGYEKGMDDWLPDYVRWSRARTREHAPARPVHIMFLTADHFEPGRDVPSGSRRATEVRREPTLEAKWRVVRCLVLAREVFWIGGGSDACGSFVCG